MKLNHLFAIAAAGSFALVACDKQTAMEEKASDAKAVVDKKMDEVKDAAKDKAPEVAAEVNKSADAAKDAAAKVEDAAKNPAPPVPPPPVPPAPPAVPDAPK